MIIFNKKFLFLLIPVCLLAAFAIVLTDSNQEGETANIAQYTIKHSVQNMPDLEHLSASIIVNNSERMEAQFNKNAMMESGLFQFSETVESIPDIYVMTYRIEKDNFDIMDIVISVANNTIKMKVENLPTESLVSLATNQKTKQDKVPVDWAGQLELISFSNERNNTCVNIMINDETQSICHSIEQERQAA